MAKKGDLLAGSRSQLVSASAVSTENATCIPTSDACMALLPMIPSRVEIVSGNSTKLALDSFWCVVSAYHPSMVREAYATTRPDAASYVDSMYDPSRVDVNLMPRLRGDTVRMAKSTLFFAGV